LKSTTYQSDLEMPIEPKFIIAIRLRETIEEPKLTGEKIDEIRTA
jgi:hypothetical protein